MKRYQETWIKGRPQQGTEFQRECAPRYEPIKKVLENYKRPFSVLDIGANMGYFSFRIAEDFPHATVIMMDNKKDLLELSIANELANVVMLPVHLTGADLGVFAKCESIDVVLALNVLHHFDDWQAGLAAILEMGENIIIETPGSGDTNARNPQMHEELYAILNNQPHELIFESESHVSTAKRYMMRFEMPANRISMQTLDAKHRGAPALGSVVITSNYEEKNVIIQHLGRTPNVEMRKFFSGMNLWNWKLLRGCWPLDIPQRVIRGVEGIKGWHDDLRPWNFVLSGADCVPIDIRTKSWKTEPEENGVQECLRLLGYETANTP